MSIKISKQETINFNKLNNDPLISKETFSTENEIPAISTSAGRRNLRALENETRILSHALIESEPILQNIELYRNNPIGWPPLHYAISQGDIPAALEMIRLEPQQAFLFAPLKDMPYQTHKGAQSAQQILEKGLDATLKNFLRGPSALSLAIQNGSDVLVSALLELGVDIDAAHMRIDSVVNKLEENAHAYSNVVTAKLHTPLSLAIESKNLGLVQLLVKRGAPLTNLSQIVKVRAFRYYYQKVLDRFTQIDLARHSVFTLSKASRKLLFFFIAHQMKVDEDEVPEKFLSLYQKYSDHAQDFPPLFQAILADDQDAFSSFLEAGENPSQKFLMRNSNERFPKNVYDLAAEHPNPFYLQILPTASKPAENNRAGVSPLAQAIIQKQFDEARAILSQFPTQAKESLPFIDCTFHGYGDWAASYILKQLIECQKTPLNPSLIQGPSPLMLAIRGGSLDLVDKLLKEGADPNLGYLTVTGQKSHTPDWKLCIRLKSCGKRR